MKERRDWIVVAMFAILFFIWPISHTIALRNTLIVFLFIWAATRWDGPRARSAIALWRRPLWALGLFTLWLFFELIFTPFWRLTIGAIGGQWLSALVAAAIGASVGVLRRGPSPRAILLLFLGVLGIHVLVVDGQGAAWAIHHGHLPMGLNGRREKGLTAGPDKSNYLTNTFLDLLVAELSLRLEGRRFLPGGAWLLAVALLMGAVSSYLEAMRNGLIDVLVLATFLGFRFVYRHRAQLDTRRRLVMGGMTLVVAILVGLDLRFDPRWATFFATIPIAWNTQAHRLAWLTPNSPLPLLPNGHHVAQSNYLRIAWIKEGFKSLFAFPLGLGYGRSAFGRALLLRFGPHAGMATSTNNGFLNLALGVGFPGLMLWYLWYGCFVKKAVYFVSGPAAFWGRALLLVLLDAGTRMLVDANMQDYMLEIFMFLIALLATGVAAAIAEDTKSRAARAVSKRSVQP